MHTLNVGITYPNHFTCIICCYSEHELDPERIKDCVDRLLRVGLMTCPTIDKIFDFIVAGIRKDCGCQAIKVLADHTKTISWMGVSQDGFGDAEEGGEYGT